MNWREKEKVIRDLGYTDLPDESFPDDYRQEMVEFLYEDMELDRCEHD